MTTLDDLHNAYRVSVAADRAWHDELVKAYGKQAFDARYNIRLNAATPALKAAHDAAMAAKARRAEIRAQWLIANGGRA